MPKWEQTERGSYQLIVNGYYLIVYNVGKVWYSFHTAQRRLQAINTEDALVEAYEIERNFLTTELSNLTGVS
jgi:hypothetical protein